MIRRRAELQTVVVIGGGASGTLAALHLARCGTARRVLLIEGRGRFGCGVAYGTPDDAHVLNVRAGGMSAYPHDPTHFARWTGAGAGEFVARRRFGDYLEALVHDAGDVVEPVVARVVGVTPGRCGVVVELDDGRALGAEAAVLALGAFPPLAPSQLPAPVVASPRYVPDPWRPGALDAIGDEDPVLLVGTGLTAVDVALSLVGRGHRGPLRAVSRHGLLPRSHRAGPCPAPRPFPVPDGPLTLGRMVRRFRSEVTAAGGDWRAVVDGLRPRTQEVWAGLTPADQRRFLRGLARQWEVHRHRMAPQVAARVQLLIANGRLTIGSGAVADAALAPRQRVVNCTGASCDVTRRRDRLVVDLLRQGHARPGPHRLGLDVADDGALVGRTGRPSPSLFTLGPLCRGRRWETTAVPEIAAQAAALAERLSSSSSRLELV